VAGEVLKKKREELGLGIAEVAELLRIKAEYLSSIEEDRFEKLPVAVYTVGYIRCYAAYLHVDPEPILSFYSGNLVQPPPSTVFPVASSMKRTPVYYYVAPLVILLLVSFAIFIVTWQDGPGKEEKTVPEPVHPAQGEKPQQAEPIPQIMPQLPPAVSPAEKNHVPEGASEVSEHRIEITALDLAWVQITFPEGGAEEALLRPGEVKRWIFSDKAMLKLGNAGGVTLNLDGRDIGTPGGPAQVLTIALPENRQVAKDSGPGDER
jgi:transcriptional regulator with XRE-family HTH domain